MKVRDLMVTPVHSLGPEANVADVSDLMRSEKIRHVPIVGPAGEVMGLATHRDVLGKALGGGEDLPLSIRRPYLRSIPVAEIMVTDVATASSGSTLADAACRMLARRHGCIPVVDDGELVGILTSSDFVRYVAGCAPVEDPSP